MSFFDAYYEAKCLLFSDPSPVVLVGDDPRYSLVAGARYIVTNDLIWPALYVVGSNDAM